MIMPYLIINTYVSLMYELKKNGKLFTSKFVGTGPSSYKKRIYRAAVSQRLRNTVLDNTDKQCRARQATDGDMSHAHCMLNT